MSTHILIATDKFKGSLSALEAAEAIAGGLACSIPQATFDLCPLADGGEGFMKTVAGALPGEWMEVAAVDALNRPIRSRYLLAHTDEERIAVIEMAETAGMWRLTREELDPLSASTRGVGMQIRDAVGRHAVDRVVVGLGGSATNDAGCGMAAELGVRFLDGHGQDLDPSPQGLGRLHSIDRDSIECLPSIQVACDVDNPLLGPRGATSVFSTQKGADAEDQSILERQLEHLVSVARAQVDAAQAGAGAAGGLGFGFVHFAGAELVSGFELVSDLLDLAARIRKADLVVTGEGSLDAQSLGGKAPVALAQQARALSKPTVAFCGKADEEVRNSGLFQQILALSETGFPEVELMRDAGKLLAQLADSFRPD